MKRDMTFTQAAMSARGPYHVQRKVQLACGKYETRELRRGESGVLFLRMDGSDEQRHLTLEDVCANDWRESL